MYIETYGCQMNVNDSEVAWSILKNSGYVKTPDVKEVRVQCARWLYYDLVMTL